MYHGMMKPGYCPPLIILAAFLFFLIGCATGEKKEPTPETIIAEKAFALSLEIRDAYTAQDLRKLRTLCSETLSNDLSLQREKYKSVKLDFTMRWVDIEQDGTVHLYVAWKRKALTTVQATEDSGMGVFILKGDPLKADTILRDNPFQ
ncbi:MAG: hypothetical protein ACM34I_03425 [bacterium]